MLVKIVNVPYMTYDLIWERAVYLFIMWEITEKMEFMNLIYGRYGTVIGFMKLLF